MKKMKDCKRGMHRPQPEIDGIFGSDRQKRSKTGKQTPLNSKQNL